MRDKTRFQMMNCQSMLRKMNLLKTKTTTSAAIIDALPVEGMRLPELRKLLHNMVCETCNEISMKQPIQLFAVL